MFHLFITNLFPSSDNELLKSRDLVSFICQSQCLKLLCPKSQTPEDHLGANTGEKAKSLFSSSFELSLLSALMQQRDAREREPVSKTQRFYGALGAVGGVRTRSWLIGWGVGRLLADR